MNLCKSQASFIVIVVYRNQQVGCLKVAQIYTGSPLGLFVDRNSNRVLHQMEPPEFPDNLGDIAPLGGANARCLPGLRVDGFQ